jgi:hypothetical protein
VKRVTTGISHSTRAAEKVLQDFFGDVRLDETPLAPKAAVVATAIDV